MDSPSAFLVFSVCFSCLMKYNFDLHDFKRLLVFLSKLKKNTGKLHKNEVILVNIKLGFF